MSTKEVWIQQEGKCYTCGRRIFMDPYYLWHHFETWIDERPRPSGYNDHPMFKEGCQ